jgi:hypothetical protein
VASAAVAAVRVRARCGAERRGPWAEGGRERDVAIVLVWVGGATVTEDGPVRAV